MGRWWARAVGLALGVCTALGCGAVDEAREPVPDEALRPVPETQQDPLPAPGTEVPSPSPSPWRPEEPLWTVQASLPHFQDVAGLASDGAGGFVVLATNPYYGFVDDESPPGNLVLTRYDSRGSPLWSRTLAATPDPGPWVLRQSSTLAVSPTGDVFVAVQTQGGGALRLGDTLTPGDSFIVKLGADGTPRWVLAEQAGVLAADPDGGVVVATQLGTVSRYDAGGVRQWTWGASDGSLIFTAVGVGPAGNVVAAGHQLIDLSYGTGFIVALSSSGSERWWSTTPREAGWVTFSDLAVLPDGGLLLTGSFRQSFLWGNYRVNRACATPGSCIPTAALLVADAGGQPLWAEDLEGSSINPRVAVGRDGDALVFWEWQCNVGMTRFSPSGEVRWRSRDVTGPCTQNLLAPRDVDFLSDGSLVRAGQFTGARTFRDGASFVADEDGDVYIQRLKP